MVVRGRSVVDVGSGSGLVAVAAGLAGARCVLAVDRDPYAVAATRLNAGLNGVRLDVEAADVAVPTELPAPLHDRVLGADVVLAGDMFFERDLATAMLALLRAAAAAGAEVLVGDPGRAHLPPDAFTEVAGYDVPVSAALEDAPVRRTRVLRLVP